MRAGGLPLSFLLAALTALSGCAGPPAGPAVSFMEGQDGAEPFTAASAGEADQLELEVNGSRYSVRLADTDAAAELAGRLPLELEMEELNGNEKYAYLEAPLPSAEEAPGEIHAGDLMLYGDDCLVLFYRSFESGYRYTPLGSLEDPAGLEELLGSGSVSATLRFTE